MIIKIKPLSINQAWKGRRFRSDKYNKYKKELSLLLPNLDIEFKGDLKACFTFGFSSKGSDIDNPIKPLIDILQLKYGFNDNQIKRLEVDKEIVKKGNEFINIQITTL